MDKSGQSCFCDNCDSFLRCEKLKGHLQSVLDVLTSLAYDVESYVDDCKYEVVING